MKNSIIEKLIDKLSRERQDLAEELIKYENKNLINQMLIDSIIRVDARIDSLLMQLNE